MDGVRDLDHIDLDITLHYMTNTHTHGHSLLKDMWIIINKKNFLL